MIRPILAFAALFALAGCVVPERLAQVGKAPDLAPIDGSALARLEQAPRAVGEVEF